jgi:hypothetical protein
MLGAVLGSNRRNDMTLTLNPAGRARFLSWLQDVGRSTLRPDAVESEMLQIMEDRAESGESLSYELGGQYTTSGRPELFYATAADFDQDDDDAAAERDAALESAFADAIGHDKYQRLLDESWQPFAGKAHLSMSLEDAVAREVKAATEFLETLADDKQEHIISAVLGKDAEVIELSFDPVRPESPVFYRYPDVSEDWQSCPFQSADVRHLSDEAACAMVNNWVG